MNINKACGCYAIISRKVRYLLMSHLGPYRHYRHCNLYTKFHSSSLPSHQSYGGKVLDSFSIKLLNRFTYLPETWAPGLIEQAPAINMAVFTTSNMQAWAIELFSNLECSIRKNSTLGSVVPAHDDANRRASRSGKVLRSFTELCTLHTLDGPDLLC